jgi:hypothetical protein
MKQSKPPEGATLFQVYGRRREMRKPSIGKISKWKARRNVDERKMIKDLHYEDTFAPVLQWESIRYFLTMHIPSKWHTRQLDFVVAYTQANINRESYMKLPYQDSKYQVKS